MMFGANRLLRALTSPTAHPSIPQGERWKISGGGNGGRFQKSGNGGRFQKSGNGGRFQKSGNGGRLQARKRWGISVREWQEISVWVLPRHAPKPPSPFALRYRRVSGSHRCRHNAPLARDPTHSHAGSARPSQQRTRLQSPRVTPIPFRFLLSTPTQCPIACCCASLPMVA